MCDTPSEERKNASLEKGGISNSIPKDIQACGKSILSFTQAWGIYKLICRTIILLRHVQR